MPMIWPSLRTGSPALIGWIAIFVTAHDRLQNGQRAQPDGLPRSEVAGRNDQGSEGLRCSTGGRLLMSSILDSRSWRYRERRGMPGNYVFPG